MNPKLQTALFAKILDTLDVTLHWKKQTALQVGAKKEHKANYSHSFQNHSFPGFEEFKAQKHL